MPVDSDLALLFGVPGLLGGTGGGGELDPDTLLDELDDPILDENDEPILADV